MRLLRIVWLYALVLWRWFCAPFVLLYKLYVTVRLAIGKYVLSSLDDWMSDAGWKRHERRQFWREFVKTQSARNEVFRRL